MKRVLLFTMIMVLAVVGVFAAEDKTSADAKVKLDLNVEKFVIGFANSKTNAQTFSKVKDDYDFDIKSKVNGNVNKLEVLTQQKDNMYFFYDAALLKGLTYKLYAKINDPLTEQNSTDTGVATYTSSNPDTISYTATIKDNVEKATAFVDGTWVTGVNTTDVVISSPAYNATSTYTEVRNLRGSATAPFTVVYASAFEIDLKVDGDQNLGSKKAAVYRSTISFKVATV